MKSLNLIKETKKMINLKQYSELKAKKAVSIVKAGDSFAVAYKKFDENTGVVLPDEVLGINMQELLDKKKELQDEIAEIDAFIADTNLL